MSEESNPIKKSASKSTLLDGIDRKLLGHLAVDATLSYAMLGELVHLSAPAVHERVKRLKHHGIIKATVASLDGAMLGRPLLAFINVDTKSWAKTRQLIQLVDLPEIEEIHTVTGESAVLLKVRTRDTQTLEKLLAIIHGIEGIEATRSSIALSTYLERGPSPIAD